MKKFICGCDPLAVQRLNGEADPACLPVTAQELARIGIPPHKLRRVRQELARLVTLDPALRDRKVLLKLARKLAAQFW